MCPWQVPKKQGLTGKKKLAKVLNSAMADIKRKVTADKTCKPYWEVFSVSLFFFVNIYLSRQD